MVLFFYIVPLCKQYDFYIPHVPVHLNFVLLHVFEKNIESALRDTHAVHTPKTHHCALAVNSQVQKYLNSDTMYATAMDLKLNYQDALKV